MGEESSTVVGLMKSYELGDPVLDQRLKELVRDACGGEVDPDEDIISEMLVSGLKMLRDSTDRGDLKLANAALKEMRYSFLIFGRYRGTRKVTIFGSARTERDHPNYKLAAQFAKVMTADRGWMVITGAGPGIMEAGNMGAGADAGFGVNIRLPFEGDANPYVHESRLINFKYFFTRKLMFVKESDGFALFPGGFGTQDETFELLTLVQTGKSDLHPIVLVEADGTGYWESWLRFASDLADQGMISPDDFNLFTQVATVTEAADEICGFYDNYHSQRFVDGKLVLRLQRRPSPALVEQLNDEFSDIVASGRIEAIEATPDEIRDRDHVDLHRLRLQFDRRSFGKLRLLVNRLSAAAQDEPGEPGAAAS